ncbi:glucose-1-phosphate thymidylyltransferase [Halorubrum sp. 48-1-W]|uniref:bifunctional sugar-1-phosphate nucleotidylyltransferase/acetyltransferase n=1 Tax=Halorubrum sp. 48-1-W TaxID=2249761 RepID=UPI000DCCAD77|nr:bifunctional sugar-1-phosphate nucleotidylyltransferase/acetyltransferase [Halorubrum sp. 48-1-W]RAW46856.1 glucose-1-phosphate thymidylyltransferase [Halorubrum sp. 48-1-W]
MQTVVLAAGEGTRMRPLTANTPKPMLPVAGKPLVVRCLEDAIAAGASRVVVVVGYEADVVRTALDEHDWPVPVETVEQVEQRGTADAVRAARSELDEGPFVVLNGDALYDRGSLTTLYDADAAVGSYRVENPSSYGVLRVADGRVAGVVEKPADPPSNLVNTGAYVFPAEALAWLDVDESERGELELTDVLQRACETADVRSISFDRWLDVGRPWELLAANEWKLAELDRELVGDVSDDAELRGAVVVEEGATVEPGVVIEGPAYVSADSHVGPNAYVRGATYLGPEVRVGHGVEVKNSVVMADSAVPHLTYLGDSVLGEDVNLGAGTTVANLRHDGEPVDLTVKGDRVSTGRRKFGIVCGDGVRTGINCTINVGIVLSSGATVAPGETVLRDR